MRNGARGGMVSLPPFGDRGEAVYPVSHNADRVFLFIGSPSIAPASAAPATAVPAPRTSARGSAAEVDSAAVAGSKSRYLKGNILGLTKLGMRKVSLEVREPRFAEAEIIRQCAIVHDIRSNNVYVSRARSFPSD